MNDQLIIGEKASVDDYAASVASRKIGLPKKKTIKETIPFSNETYDFSKINGELYWEERELEYVFEMIASTPEELEEMKTAFSSWVMNVFNEDIHDPFIPYYHFVGTYDDIDFQDEETLDKTTATVKFMAYPYKLADNPTVFTFESYGVVSKEWYIENNSSHRVKATLGIAFNESVPEGTEVSVSINGATPIRVAASETAQVLLPVGTVKIGITTVNYNIPYTCQILFTEEVF